VLIGTGGGAGNPVYTAGNTGNGNRLRIGGGRRERSAGNYDDGDECDAVYGDGIGDGRIGNATVGTPFTSGQLNFTIAAGSTAFAAGDKITVTTTPLTLANVTAIPITGFADGATNQTFNWNVLSGTNPLIAQVAAPSSASAIDQDGSSSGSLVNFTIGGDGTITDRSATARRRPWDK